MRVCSVRDEGKIKPIIAGKFPLLEAAKANEVLESGRVNGKIVLLAPEPWEEQLNS
jgi:NADPH:quinone reductase-like Zn-dependent oxidoreductase